MGHFDRWFIFIVATNCIKGCVGFVNPQPWQPWVPWHPKPYVPRQVGAPFLPPVNQVAGPVFNPLISAQRPPHFYPWHMPWAVPQYGLSPNVPQVNPPQAVSWRPGQFPYYSKPSQYYSNYGQMQPNPVFQQSRFPFQGSLMPAAKQAVLPVRTIQRNPAFLPKYQGIKGNPFAYKPQSRLFDLNNNYGGSQHPNQPVKGRQQLQEPLQFFGR